MTGSALEAFARDASLYAREEPAKALGTAFGVGFLFALLPIGRVLSALLGILMQLLRPALLLLGFVKLLETAGIDCCRPGSPKAQSEPPANP
ncbi:MAG: hypothetical protein RLZZ399_2455 [Verrucomicrobiota bacterium]|jgi:hypothetical protein